MSEKNESMRTDESLFQIDRKTMGKRISERRGELGLDAYDIATRLGYEDVKSYQRIEYGLRGCPQDKLCALSRILEVTVDYLLFGDEDQKKCEDIMKKLLVLDGEHLTWILGVIDMLMKHPA